jgi:fructokinase
MFYPRIATAGEALIDLVAQPNGQLLPCLGGAVYNLSRALGRQGQALCYLNAFSMDRFGGMLGEQLARDGCRLSQPQAIPQPSSLAIIAIDVLGKPNYSFYRDGVADRTVSASRLVSLTETMSTLEVVATGCLALAPEDQHIYHPWLEACQVAGQAIVIDINMRPAVISDASAYRRSVLKAVSYADLIKASDEDLDYLFDGLGDPLVAAQALFELSPARWVALTLGDKGAYLLARDGQLWHGQDLSTLHIADTVGAGDCFLAGLMGSLIGEQKGANLLLQASSLAINEERAAQALRCAIASASHCIEQVGCEPPSAEQVVARLTQDQIKIQAFASGQTPGH